MVTSLFAPGLKHIHPIRAEDPEESLVLMPHGTFWPLFHGSMPSYRDWYAQRSAAELAGDYECLKQGLQVLQHGRAPKRWIVKYPAHLNDMTVIKKVFPDATFVWTHRDPATVVGSSCSLIETLWAPYQTDPDPLEVGQLVMDSMVTWVNNALEARLSLPPSSIVDVPYHALSADPHTEVPRVYSAIGATWSASDEAKLDQVLARPAGSTPHQYDMRRYGLEPDQVDAGVRGLPAPAEHFRRAGREAQVEMSERGRVEPGGRTASRRRSARPPAAARTYGCCGSSKTVAAGPDPTMRPACMHRDVVAHVQRDPEVVRDEQVGEVPLALEPVEQVEHLRLDRDVERGDRLVEDQHPGVGRERPRDGDALPLAAGQVQRAAGGQGRIEAHRAEQLRDLARGRVRAGWPGRG